MADASPSTANTGHFQSVKLGCLEVLKLRTLTHYQARVRTNLPCYHQSGCLTVKSTKDG
ncbi:hypothetical protein BDW72DRAFT_184481 [Aspergillus terricola var. indicus]